MPRYLQPVREHTGLARHAAAKPPALGASVGSRLHTPRPSHYDRLACVHVPALPLQLLARRHPEWAGRPIAVVDEDKPQGTVVWVNEKAYQSRVLPGTRYAAGLSLCRRLCAGEVPEEEIDEGTRRLVELLWRFSPEIEPSPEEPGVFWLNASGLGRIETSLSIWARRLRAELAKDGFVSRVAVGFSRFGTYAAARTTHDVTIFEQPSAEQDTARTIRLDRLRLEPKLRDSLDKLGVRTVEQFLELPPDGLGKRFGSIAIDFYKEASGESEKPLDPVSPPVPVEGCIEFEYPEADSTRLLFIIKRSLPVLIEQLAGWHQGLTELVLVMQLDDGTHVTKSVRPAEATLDGAIILDLVRLRLENTDVTGGVVELLVTAHGTRVSDEQLELFWNQPKRDLDAANRALARVRAEFGRESVVWAKPREAHLPEASFTWEPVERAKLAATIERSVLPLVRRIFQKAIQLPARERHEPDGWLIRGLEQGPAVRMRGPYVVSGGWWVREVHREYYFVETQRGDVLWIYYDRHRRQWMLQGQVD